MKSVNVTSLALSRIDLLVLLAVLAALALVAIPALAKSRAPGQSTLCQNNLRQLGVALLMYSAENDFYLPSRFTPPNAWPQRLRPYYRDLQLLRCPVDLQPHSSGGSGPSADYAPRSYIYNGFNDYTSELNFTNWDLRTPYPIPEQAIPLPAQTILLGEKVAGSRHLYMDFLEGLGNDLIEADPHHHFYSLQSMARSGSNYTFADGSVRFLEYDQSFIPENLWAVVEAWRYPLF